MRPIVKILIMACSILASFLPAKSFADDKTPKLTAVFFKLADSLEQNGSPVPYWNQVKLDAGRIENIYIQKFGNNPIVYHPTFLADGRADRAVKNWEALSPKLGLEPLSRNIGGILRNCVTHPAAVSLLEEQERLISTAMTVDGNESEAFDEFEKAVLKISPQIGGSSITNMIANLFQRLDAALKPEDAAKIKTALIGAFNETVEAALIEYELELENSAVERGSSLLENAKQKFPVPASYSADQETALSESEREIFASFLKKDKFTRDDFPALEKFYTSSYDKLSVTGKAEMSMRIHAGLRKDN
ncbi:MAG TPA: hypothetical protein VG347_08490 [Verrucomicrobiae bacterium]|nr:hypothetical protein [Verrucomicrobiae bacterium]